MNSKCTVSFGRHDFQTNRLGKKLCPVANCNAHLSEAPYQRLKGKTQYLPFCPVHGIRIHKNTFVYFNGETTEAKNLALKRNLAFNADFYINKIAIGGVKLETGRLCYESSEDAVSWNVFTEIAKSKVSLSNLITLITGKHYEEHADLYLWGGKIDFRNGTFKQYEPLKDVRKHLESDIKQFPTEPDIMLVIPKKLVICIEAKFGSKNPVAGDLKTIEGGKPKKVSELMQKYYYKNNYLKSDIIFNASKLPKPFYEQLFRNIIFAASMAKLEGNADWYVANLRSEHVINLNKNRPEGAPVLKNIRLFLAKEYKNRFNHITWEDIFKHAVKDNLDLADLNWYLKNKSLNCARAFNII